LLVDLHNDGNATQPSKDGQCNKIDPQVVQQVVAASWAIDVINNQSLPSDLKIGKIYVLKNLNHFYELMYK